MDKNVIEKHGHVQAIIYVFKFIKSKPNAIAVHRTPITL